MPGIVGFITKAPLDQVEPQLLRMVAALRHEPFYTTGTWIDESLGVYVGWVTQQGSFSDGMPLQNETGDVILAFSGEEFPEPDAPRGLQARGHRLGPQQASYLPHLYEEDCTFPAKLNGRFHGLLVDRKQDTATLFNDRYGMHRLYYHEAKDAFYFAAEAKAIMAVRPELRSLDARGLGEFISCGCVLENRTLFSGIHVLPSASAWRFRNGAIEQRGSYFQPEEWEQQPLLEPEAYYRELRDVFAKTLPHYFAGPQRIGMSLTGGLDTRMILAWHKPAPGSLPCYSFGSMYRDSQDVQVARKVAAACGQPHEVIPVGQEFLSRFAHYAERAVYLTDGCLSVRYSPDLYLNEKARAIAPVRMTGNYGGEVLRRIRAFKPVDPPAGLFSPEILTSVQQAKKTYAGLLTGHPLSFAVFKQAPWHHYGLLALEQTQVALRSPFLDNEFVRTVYRAPASALTTNDVSLHLIHDGNPALARLRTDRGLAGRGGLQGAMSQKLLEFTFKAEYACDYGMPQWLARVDHGLAALHPERLFLGRHKFAHFRVWYRDALAGYVREVLLDPRALSRAYVERKQLETMVAGHLRGGSNHTTALHTLLTLELIHRLFIES